MEEEFDPPELLVHLAPWQSGLEDVDLTRSLIQDNMSAGYAFVLEGGEPEARRRWGKLVASGKLGVVRAPGKKPRLIGDGSVSGANRASRIHEHVRLPGLQGIQRFLSMPAAQEKSWVAFSFDVAAAHKRVLTCEQEQGLCCFVLEGVWYVYRSCFFGTKWSAYWWSRVGAWLVRMLHRFIWLQHGLWLYVDDGMLLLPKSVAPLVGGVAVMFLRALGVPLSWRKLDLGTQLVWIGWKFNLEGAHASLPLEKREKLSILLGPLCKKGAKVERREVESLIGLLIWFTAGAFWLRPWLSNFYNLLYKPSAVPRLLSIDQFQELVSSLSQDLRVLRPLKQCDNCANWQLHTVANLPVSGLAAPGLLAPRSRHGRVSCVFFNFDSKLVTSNGDCVHAAKLFTQVLRVQRTLLLLLTVPESAVGGCLLGWKSCRNK